jgi:hypothetical protein
MLTRYPARTSAAVGAAYRTSPTLPRSKTPSPIALIRRQWHARTHIVDGSRTQPLRCVRAKVLKGGDESERV